MTSEQQISAIYKEFVKAYEPVTRELTAKIFSGDVDPEHQKVIFPPRDGVPFDVLHAEAGFLKFDCGILTAFRATNSLERNRELNELLRQDLEAAGIDNEHYRLVEGCFREALEDEPSIEDSFFVFDDGTHHPLPFFTALYKISEKYGQDSFLYKAAGMTRTAFLISTNDDSRQQDGNISLAGQLYLNLPPVGPYTHFPSGCIHFLRETPV